MGGAERLWWLLRHWGHDACALINLDAWLGPLRTGDEAVEPASFVPRPRTDDTISADELAARYLSSSSSTRGSHRGGAASRIRSTRRPTRARCAQRSVERAAARPSAGPARRVLRLGVTATVVLHRLALADREERLYPGSWSEWEQRPELPRESS